MIDRIASHAANDHSKQSVVPRKYSYALWYESRIQRRLIH